MKTKKVTTKSRKQRIYFVDSLIPGYTTFENAALAAHTHGDRAVEMRDNATPDDPSSGNLVRTIEIGEKGLGLVLRDFFTNQTCYRKVTYKDVCQALTKFIFEISAGSAEDWNNTIL